MVFSFKYLYFCRKARQLFQVGHDSEPVYPADQIILTKIGPGFNRLRILFVRLSSFFTNESKGGHKSAILFSDNSFSEREMRTDFPDTEI
jgi:hypothetical protein